MFDLIPVKIWHIIGGILITVLLITLQIIGIIEFSWWLLLIPSIIPLTIIAIIILIAIFIIYKNTD